MEKSGQLRADYRYEKPKPFTFRSEASELYICNFDYSYVYNHHTGRDQSHTGYATLHALLHWNIW